MMTNKFLSPSLFLLIAIFFQPGCGNLSSKDSSKNLVCRKLVCYEVEVVQKENEVRRGLMFRESLDQDKGMLFVFTRNDIHSFWMQNTKIPLDVLFFDAEGDYISHQTMDPCLPAASTSSLLRSATEGQAAQAPLDCMTSGG